jgi:hypothetical protein
VGHVLQGAIAARKNVRGEQSDTGEPSAPTWAGADALDKSNRFRGAAWRHPRAPSTVGLPMAASLPGRHKPSLGAVRAKPARFGAGKRPGRNDFAPARRLASTTARRKLSPAVGPVHGTTANRRFLEPDRNRLLREGIVHGVFIFAVDAGTSRRQPEEIDGRCPCRPLSVRLPLSVVLP